MDIIRAIEQGEHLDEISIKFGNPHPMMQLPAESEKYNHFTFWYVDLTRRADGSNQNHWKKRCGMSIKKFVVCIHKLEKKPYKMWDLLVLNLLVFICFD